MARFYGTINSDILEGDDSISVQENVQNPIIFPNDPRYPTDIYLSSDDDVDLLGMPSGTSFLDLIDIR